MIPFAPAGYSQMDGSRWQSANCVLATTTNLIDRATVGALRIQAPVLRTISGDTSGGVTYQQAAATAYKATKAKGWPVTLVPRSGLSRDQVQDLGEAGIPFGISIDTSVTRPTPFRTGTFIGGHTVYVNDYDAGRDTFLVEDPGTTAAGYLWWPADLLYRAAERRGGGRINVLTGPDTEDVIRKARIAVLVRKTPSMTAADVGIGNTVVGRAYHVLETVNGGQWPRKGGGVATGWHRGTKGYVRGSAFG